MREKWANKAIVENLHHTLYFKSDYFVSKII